MTLKQKNIIVGIGGGVAGYKAAELVRLLRKAHANVQVVMTKAAAQFITPLTLQALSGNLVRNDLFSLSAENAMSHIELARWADLIVIAPATANILAQLAQGFSDDLLSTLCLATTAKVALVPAMNQQMWHHPATQNNLSRLQSLQYLIWGPDSGEQACGEIGLGRMLESLTILQQIENYLQPKQFSGKKIMITAGATREHLDPVRCLTNVSSGKMGYALAQAAYAQGAEVLLISGHTALTVPEGIKRITVNSALDMHRTVMENLAGTEIFIGAAAVTDYRPEQYCQEKIKKKGSNATAFNFIANPDIIAEVAASKLRPKCVIGFAAETENCIDHAIQKLKKKKLDFIIANQVGVGQGIETDDNAATLIGVNGVVDEFKRMSKTALARKIISNLYHPNSF